MAGRSRRDANRGIHLGRPLVPLSGAIGILAAMGLFGAVPHADELRRRLRAKREGRDGQDSPA